MKKISTFFLASSLLVSQSALAGHYDKMKKQAEQFVTFDPEYSYQILDQNSNVPYKPLLIIEHKQKNPKTPKLILSGQARANVFAMRTNRTDKFPWMMSFPDDFSGKSGSAIALHNVDLALTGHISKDWTMYAQTQWNPSRTFSQSTPVGFGKTSVSSRQNISIRRAYVLYADPDKHNFYGYIGKMTVPFTNSQTLNPFSINLHSHAFEPLANAIAVGYNHENVILTGSVLQGGPQFRVASGKKDGRIDNFAISGKLKTKYSDGYASLGGGYLHSTEFCTSFPSIHFKLCERRNPAFNINAYGSYKDFELYGEFSQTTKEWPATAGSPSNAAIGQFIPASKVSAFVVEGRYNFDVWKKKTAISAGFSQIKLGKSKSPWEFNRQLTVGLSSFLLKNVKVFLEYNHLQGFAPLNEFSGTEKTVGNVGPSPSDRSTRSNVITAGITAAL